EKIARLLSDAGFAVISGGGPGIMEAANKGAFFGPSASIGLNIQLIHEQHANRYQDISQTFRHFFARKVMFVKFASAYVVMPGGFGTLDELMEALTLVQTGKTRKIPIILVHSPFWKGLIDWLKEVLIAEGMISPGDVDLIQIIDEPEAVVDAIFKHYETRGFSPSEAEHEIQLNL
ncbi:MAG TPA: TIGR00730 family Rossman fold protein, partial [Burkholderiales bacterium]|nr:TIGR00730 family Rossman fold protein [Burkholderiales bacterium]